MKIILPGGSGQVGTLLARAFHTADHEVVVLSRRPSPAAWRVIAWDAETLGDWVSELEGADVVVNLAGRSVNCRYTAANRQRILESRVKSTRVVGEAIARVARPPRVWLQSSTATIYAHRYDAAGNLTWEKDYRNNAGSQTLHHEIRYGYDERDRLTSAATQANTTGEQPNISESYGYDAIGNLTSKTGAGSYGYNGGKPHAVTHLDGAQRYWYDASGNLTWRDEGSQKWYQAWTEEHKLKDVQPCDAAWQCSPAITQFFYDADGNRVKKVENNQTTVYVGDSFEKNVTTGEYTHYYYLGGQRIAMRKSTDPARGTGTVTWLHGDHLGSASIATADTGQPVTSSETRYTPYGEVRPGFGTGIPTNRKFTGQREESNIGLYDYGARFYSPMLGRFISADTLVPGAGNPQALNRYSMVFNNPLKYTDPTGHCPAPASPHGNIICFALFIKPTSVAIEGTLGIVSLHGDGRDFSSNSPESQSRFWARIYLDNLGTNAPQGKQGINSTGYRLAGFEHTQWADPDLTANRFDVIPGENGAFTIKYDLVLAGALRDIGPHINGEITFMPDGSGGYTAKGQRDGFPWAEAYLHHQDGRVQTIFRRPALGSDSENLNAIEDVDLLSTRRPLHWLRHNFIHLPFFRAVQGRGTGVDEFDCRILGSKC